MATERQVEANRRNAGRSTGPKTEAGKARSRLNAHRHGLAGESVAVEADASPEFLERRAKWAAGRELRDEAAGWALDRAVAASLRVEKCERALDQVVSVGQRRASLCWEQDRALEAELVAASLAEEPALTFRRLQTTRAGLDWLIDAWLGLVDVLDNGQAWSEAQDSKALDLLGLALDRRGESTKAAELDRARLIEGQRSLATEELERLETLRDEAYVEIDEAEQALAMDGGALLSKPAKLILRYEREAWRRYRESMKQLDPADSNASQPASRAKPLAPSPSPRPRVADPRPVARLESSRAQVPGPLDQMKAMGLTIPDWVQTIPEGDDEAWYEEFERRAEARGLAGFPA